MSRKIQCGCTVDVRELENGEKGSVRISSNNNNPNLVDIAVGLESFTVYGDEMIEAIQKAMVETRYSW